MKTVESRADCNKNNNESMLPFSHQIYQCIQTGSKATRIHCKKIWFLLISITALTYCVHDQCRTRWQIQHILRLLPMPNYNRSTYQKGFPAEFRGGKYWKNVMRTLEYLFMMMSNITHSYWAIVLRLAVYSSSLFLCECIRARNGQNFRRSSLLLFDKAAVCSVLSV